MAVATAGDCGEDAGPARGSWAAVAVAWVAIGIPLAWGILQTVAKAATLFR